MLKVGITGQTGFIGKHLYNTIDLYPGEFQRVDFNKECFDDDTLMDQFVHQCDIIVHLAAVNRHHDPQIIYDTNTVLVDKLICSLTRCGSKPHVIFSSSIQENRDNLYGQSKTAGRKALADWALRSGGKFTGMLIPNVFGPFGAPYYNSVIATFCHQLTHAETPRIDVDGELKLIFVGDLVAAILDCIRNNKIADQLEIPFTHQAKVSELLTLLESYRDQYQAGGIIPVIKNSFERDLFNTFRCYMDVRNHFPVKYKQHIDPRGAFVEIARLNVGGQVSFSTTVPGITRGNHFHTRKIERFAVIKGEALIQLRQIGTDDIIDFHLSGSEPAFVDMPIWYTHNIKNIGIDELLTVFWINEPFDPTDPDTYMKTV